MRPTVIVEIQEAVQFLEHLRRFRESPSGIELLIIGAVAPFYFPILSRCSN